MTPIDAHAITRTSWSELLPAHRVGGGELPDGAPTYVDHLALSDRHLLVLVCDDIGRIYPVPMSIDDTSRCVPGDGAADDLVALIAAGTRASNRFTVTSWHDTAVTGEAAIAVDQTNESVIVGDAAVVKLAFQVEPGPHPAPTLLRELAQHDFRGTPQPWGLIEWRRDDEPPTLIASVVAYLPGAVDGWTWAVDDLRAAVVADDASAVVEAGERVGTLVADFHRALSTTSRAATSNEVRRWHTDAIADLDTALSASTGRSRDVLASHANDVRGAFAKLASHSKRAVADVMRVHGDLHVGQVLRSSDESGQRYVLIDFDGNPVVSPHERLALQPAALDVAGMAQSVSHIGLVLAKHEPHHDVSVVAAMSDAFVRSFLDAYRDASDSPHLDDDLVMLFRLRQICREFSYAASHLPRWSYVPESALPALLQQEGLS